jgi:hypothetical protein
MWREAGEYSARKKAQNTESATWVADFAPPQICIQSEGSAAFAYPA